MTMNEMVLYLENQGFKTAKNYWHRVQKYKFTLTKDGVTRDYWFEYPKEDEYTRHKIQRRWLEETIKDFKKWEAMSKIQASSTALRGNMDTGYYYPRIEVEELYTNAINAMRRYGGHGSEESMNYINNDLEETKNMNNYVYYGSRANRGTYVKYGNIGLPAIEKVIFNAPATIVLWKDGTKTVVKAENEWFDPEKGLAMAIAKKAMGNKGNYFNEIKKWTEPYKAEQAWEGNFEVDVDVADAFKNFVANALGLKKDEKSENEEV